MSGYEDYLSSLKAEQDKQNRLVYTLGEAATTNPDEFASMVKLSRAAKMSVEAVPDYRDLAEQAKYLGDIGLARLWRDAPKTSQFLLDENNAKLSKDDTENMSGIERISRQFFGSAAENVGRTLHGFGELANVAQRRALTGVASMILPAPMAGGKVTEESLVGPQLGDDWRDIGKQTMQYYRQNVMLPQSQQTFGDQVVGGLGQVASQVAMLPIDRGASLWAQGASILSEKTENDKAPQFNKDLAILGGSAWTGITEKWALDKLLGPMAVPIKNQLAAAIARIGIAGAAEGGQEFVENIGHDLLQKYLTNPDTKIDIGQAGQEAGVGATVGVIVRGMVESALHIKTRGERRAQQANDAEQQAQALESLASLAQNSKLNARDPETFAQFIKEATAGAPLDAVFISSQSLAQSGKAREIAAASPAVGEQLELALETGADIRIPVEDFATNIAAKGLAGDLIDHLKAEPGGMTRGEAQQLTAENTAQLDIDELGRLAIEQHRDMSHDAEVRTIQNDIAGMLDQGGRFSPQVNRTYSALPAAFFDTMATRLGKPPAELWEQYKVAIVTEPVTGVALNQEDRGAYVPASITEDQKAVIALLKSADFSTFLHESSHWFLDSFADMAQVETAIQPDMQTLLDWFGVNDLAAWEGMSLDQKRAGHEQFAKGFEQYLHEGTAPSLGLQGMFARFRSWLARVYRNLQGLDSGINGEVRAVMDRMLATDEHIREAERARELTPIFTTETEAAGHGVDWRDYTALGKEATGEALKQMEARSQRDMQWTAKLRENTVKRLNRDAADKRKALRREVEAEVARQPVYAAMRWLKHGEVTNEAGEQIKATSGHRLSLAALREMYGQSETGRANYETLGYGKYGMLSEEGLHPDLVAEIFGFRSGDAMVRELIDAQPIREVVEAVTDQRMLERYGDLSSPEAIARAADEAIHNDVRLRFLATELAGLQNAVGGAAALTRMAKDYAARLIEKLPAGKIRPTQFAAAEVKAGRLAEQALRRGDIGEAIRQKRYQVIQHAATRMAYETQSEVEKTVAFFRTVADARAEQLKTRNVDLVNTARAILAEYGVGMRGKRPREYMEAVKQYDPELYATIEPMLLDAEQDARPIDQLKVSELRALRDDIDSLWYMARRERQMEIDGQLIDRAQVAGELIERMTRLGIPNTVPGEGKAVTENEKRIRMVMGARASLRRVESWVDRMDGKKAGAFRKYLWTPISEAADAYRADSGRYLKRYRDLMKAIEPTLTQGRIAAPELGYTFGFSKGDAGKAELLHAILHTGNESNKRKLLLGRGWATERPDGTIDASKWDAFTRRMIGEGKLTKADFDFAQGVWDLLEESKPQAQKTHREVFGRYFDEVTADSFAIKFKDGSAGQYRGGYVPAIYDTFEVQDAAINAELDAVNQGNAFMFPATNRGFTRGRVEYNKPLALDLRLIPSHLDKVLLFAHMEPRVRDVMRTMRSKGVAGTLNRQDPVAYTDMLLPWLNRAAKQTVQTPATGWGGKAADRFFRSMRSRSGMAAMFANFTNAMQQITGLTISSVKVKPAYLKSAAWRYIRAPGEMAGEVASLSTFMANRMDSEASQMRGEIEDLLVNPNAYEKAQIWTQKHAYFLQSAFQNVVDVITWSAAYDQAVTEKQSDTEAVRHANAVVRETQGSLQSEDISRFESGTAFTRLFTQFQSYFNMQANLLGTELAKASQEAGLKAGAGRIFYVFLMAFLVPAWFSEAIVQAMRGGPGDDDHDGYLDEFMAAFFGAPLRNAAAMVPIVGQSAMLIANSFNRKPYDDRMSTAPAISMIESAASAPHSVYKAMAEDGSVKRAARDTLTLVSLVTGIPVAALGKPIGYAADMAQGRVDPTGPVDMARGLISGAASPDSKR